MQRSEIIQAVHAATAEVFSTMLGVEVEPVTEAIDEGLAGACDERGTE